LQKNSRTIELVRLVTSQTNEKSLRRITTFLAFSAPKLFQLIDKKAGLVDCFFTLTIGASNLAPKYFSRYS
jgi:hypothetical protein